MAVKTGIYQNLPATEPPVYCCFFPEDSCYITLTQINKRWIGWPYWFEDLGDGEARICLRGGKEWKLEHYREHGADLEWLNQGNRDMWLSLVDVEIDADMEKAISHAKSKLRETVRPETTGNFSQ